MENLSVKIILKTQRLSKCYENIFGPQSFLCAYKMLDGISRMLVSHLLAITLCGYVQAVTTMGKGGGGKGGGGGCRPTRQLTLR